MTYIVVIIDYVSVKKVISERIMKCDSLLLLILGVLVLPYPGQIFLACRNQKYTIIRHGLHGEVHILQL